MKGRTGAVKATRRNLKGRLVFAFLLGAAFAVGCVVAWSQIGAAVGGNSATLRELLSGKFTSFFQNHEAETHPEQTIIVTSPKIENVTITESFVCQIRSQRHIEVRALEGGYLAKILVGEGQAVKKGEQMFEILPVLYKARLEAEKAKARLAQLQYQYTQKLVEQKVVSPNEAALKQAELSEAQAKVDLAQAELKFTEIEAPFDGIVDRLLQREGSLIKEGDVLTTLADNSVMWVYFNVPEKFYLRYMAHRQEHEKEDKIVLVLADGGTFPQPGKIGAIEADFNNENGNIKFRADFANPDNLLRHGETGTIKILRPLLNALVIPQRATFDLLDKKYVWVVGEGDVVHQSLITIKYELEDVYVIESGLNVSDKIVLDGVRDVEEGEKIEFEFRSPDEVLGHQKFHAE